MFFKLSHTDTCLQPIKKKKKVIAKEGIAFPPSAHINDVLISKISRHSLKDTILKLGLICLRVTFIIEKDLISTMEEKNMDQLIKLPLKKSS